MASCSANSRKNSVSSAQRFAQITELVDTYCLSAQVVQCSLSNTYKALNKKKILSHTLCISLLNALKEMSKPLSLLCSAFEEPANLPDALIPFHLNVFMTLCDIQSQAMQVESRMRRCYEYIILSMLQEIFERRTDILHLITLLGTQLSKVNRLLKKALGRRNNQSQESPPVASNREEECIHTAVLSLEVVSDLFHEEQTEMVCLEGLEDESSESLKNILKQRKEDLIAIEKQKVEFADPRNITIDLTRQEKAIRQEIQRLQSDITILEQSNKKK